MMRKETRKFKKDGPTPKLYPLAVKVLKITGLPAPAKLLFAVLCWRAGDSDRAQASISFLTRRLKIKWHAVHRALSLLQQAGLIYEISGWSYQLNSEYRTGKSVPILKSVLKSNRQGPKSNGIGASKKLVLSLLSYWQGGNDYCQPTQREIAEALGMPRVTVRWTIDRLKQDGLLQVKQDGYHILLYRVTLDGGPARRCQ